MAVKKTSRNSSKPRTTNPLVRIERIAELLHDLRDQAKTIGLEVTEAQADLLDVMGAAEIDAHEWSDEAGAHKATVVIGERTSVDETKLRDLLDEKTWEQITSTVVDKKKLDAAIAAGDIPLAVVNKVTTITQNAPYVRVTY